MANMNKMPHKFTSKSSTYIKYDIRCMVWRGNIALIFSIVVYFYSRDPQGEEVLGVHAGGGS